MNYSNLLTLASLGGYSGYAIGNMGNRQLPDQNQRIYCAVLISRIAHSLSKSPLLASSLQSGASFLGSFPGLIVLLGTSFFDDSSYIIKRSAEGVSTLMAAHALAMLYLRKDASQAAFLIPCLASIAFKQNYLPKNLESPYNFVIRVLQPASFILSGNKVLAVLGLWQLVNMPEIRK